MWKTTQELASSLKSFCAILCWTCAVILVVMLMSLIRVSAYISSSLNLEKNETHGKDYYESLKATVHTTPYTGNATIQSVDIAKSGSFLLVFDVWDALENEETPYMIQVHSANGTFLYRIGINPTGSVGAFFDQTDEKLVLYFPRENIVVKVTSTGCFLESWTVANTKQNNEITRNLFVYNDDDFTCEVNGNIYELQKNETIYSNFRSGDRFVVTTQNEETLYCYIQQQRENTLIENLFFLYLLAAAILFFILKKRRQRFHINNRK